MNRRTIRAIAATTMLTLGSGSVGCGYLLYPERRGNRGGNIDAGTMVMDLLWLLPGLIPGVVALIVDFSSGAMYRGGRVGLVVSPDSRVAVRLPRSSKPMQLEFRLVTASHRVLAHETAVIGPSTPEGTSVQLDVGGAMQPDISRASRAPRAATAAGEAIYLEVQTDGGATARFPTSLEAA